MTVWEKFLYWMGQTGDDWLPASAAFDYNPIVTGLLVGSAVILSLVFFIIGGFFIYSARRQGFFNKEQRTATWFFVAFLLLVGACFAFKAVIIFIPLYWVYAAIKFTAAISAVMVVIILTKYMEKLSSIPTAKDWAALVREKDEAERQIKLLSEHVTSWNDSVNSRIQVLKGQHKELTDSLAAKGLPVFNIHSTEDSRKQDIQDSLEKIRLELEHLSEVMTELDEK